MTQPPQPVLFQNAVPKTLPALVAVFAVGLLWLTPGGALCQAGATTAQARSWYEKGRFKEALKVLETRERDPSLSDEERVEIYVLRAAAHAALGKTADRDAALDTLVKLRPLYELDPVVSHPEMRAALEARRTAWVTSEGLSVVDVAVAPPQVRVKLEGNLTRAKDVELFARPKGEVALLRLKVPVEGSGATFTLGEARVWEAAAAAGGLEVVAEVKDLNGIALARLGDAVTPRLIPVTAEQAALVRLPDPNAMPPPTTAEERRAEPEEEEASEEPRPRKKKARIKTVLSPLRAGGLLLGAVVAPLTLSLLSAVGCCGGCILSVALGSALDNFGLGWVQQTLQYGSLALCPTSLGLGVLGGAGALGTGVAWWVGWLSVPAKDIETPPAE